MKKLSFLALLMILSLSLMGQSVIFLHHSTGGGVWGGGIGIPQWITNYNNAHSTSYAVTEFSYPDSPYDWANYPYDFWNLWVNTGQCDNTKPGIRCIDWLTSNYNVIIIKHCFPGAGIEADSGSPLVSSATKSIENYKLQYRALRAKMDSYPSNKFIVWTLAPLHRNATDIQSAARAREFVNWVKGTWLTEDGQAHPNIYIFDFFGYAAESNPTPANGKVNCLKFDYEGDHSGNDSHPNAAANTTIMPLFGQFIVDVINNQASSVNEQEASDDAEISFYPNPANNKVKIKGAESIESVEIFDISGRLVKIFYSPEKEIDVTSLAKGTYILRINSGKKCQSSQLVID